MKWLDKLKYHLFNCRTSKYIDNDITLFIGDLSNEKYLNQLLAIINQYIKVNYNNNLEIALSLIQLLNDQCIHQFIKELNELNTAFPDLKYTIYFKRKKHTHDILGGIDLEFVVEDVLDIISVDEYFLSKIIEFFKSYWNETDDLTYHNISFGLFCAGSCCDIDTFKAINEFLKSIGIDVNKLV